MASAQAFDRAQLVAWGIETQDEIKASLGLPRSHLYAETANLSGGQSGGAGGAAFVWPLSTEFRVLNDLARVDPDYYAPRLRAFSNQLVDQYWSPLGGYDCCRGVGDRYYDDNAHLAVALMEAHRITGEAIYLDRAADVYDFLLEGAVPGHPGGSYWRVGDNSFIDSAAVLQGARAGFMLYEETGDVAYREDAEQRLAWAENTTQLSEGTFYEKLFLTGPKAGTVGDYPLVNFAGFGISANLAAYDATGDLSRLTEAQRIANASVNRYFSGANGSLNDEGYWAFELADALVDLYEHDDNSRWIDAVGDAMEWLHANKQDPNGRYGKFWGREGAQVGALSEWHLNDMASVARAFLHTGLSSPLSLAGDFNDDGVVDAADYTVWRDNVRVNVVLPNDRGAGLPINSRHRNLWQQNYGATLGGPAQTVPEPSAATLAMATWAIAVASRHRLAWPAPRG
ncbi:Glycosyl hydrolase family 76 [Botrimarina colliarenosi]|uniref:Glycosyl hydrolase family 76 n=1 Tax=Botrimarina colliarenosi TaxID=2528001 RepID=A0A5C6AN07_9BACT|nr:glycoside hydrolase family 76 protein [Botrimarina colliarenosi]TWT99543.1 Glycosyl hydrolase family 76 [Botrimarina colliarenosi]